MVKHKLDVEPGDDDLESKKLRIGDEDQTPGALTPGPIDVDLRTSGMITDEESKDVKAGSSDSKAASGSHTVEMNPTRKITLDKLPVELLREVYLALEAPDMLSFKVVSKTLYQTTRNRNGSEVVNIPEKARTDKQVFDLYFKMIWLEACVSEHVALEMMTCAHCYRTLGRAPRDREGITQEEANENGFPDECFDRTNFYRMCLECIEADEQSRDGRIYREYHIHGMLYSRCTSQNCQIRNPFEGPDWRPCRKVVEHFFERPDEEQQSNVGHDEPFIPSKICSWCFMEEAGQVIMKHLNTTMQ